MKENITESAVIVSAFAIFVLFWLMLFPYCLVKAWVRVLRIIKSRCDITTI